MTTAVRRSALAIALLLCAGASVRWAMRPAVEIAIDAAGRAGVVDAFGRRRALPDTLVIARGGRPRIRITNAAPRAHIVGLFRAPADSTVEFALPGPGRYSGQCTVHPRAQLTLLVE
ncbi:MAG: hypothetical protein MUF00_13520 [Gemmatimonadaceae bacterium]|jgi:hypothetical protein|nr:hypothetical protein [Gemmatimonadaceae bacterium]